MIPTNATADEPFSRTPSLAGSGLSRPAGWGISLATGADVWLCLLRVGAAFLVFGAAGLGLRAIMLQSASPQSPSARGRHFDQTTPEDGSGESARENPPPAGHNDIS